LEVLDQGDFRHVGVGRIAHHDGDFLESGGLRRPPAPLPGDDFVAGLHAPYDDRLDDALFPDGIDEFFLFTVPEGLPRLEAVGRQIFDSALQESRFFSNVPRQVGKHRAQSPAELIFSRHQILPLLRISCVHSI